MTDQNVQVNDARRFDGSWTVQEIDPDKQNGTIQPGAKLSFYGQSKGQAIVRLEPDPSGVGALDLSLQDGFLSGSTDSHRFEFHLVAKEESATLQLAMDYVYQSFQGGPDNGAGSTDPG